LNETIERARQAALDILQPSKKELEHGLELHKNSVVWDAYGFAPRAAIDGDALQRALESGASEEELRDMSEDMAMTRMVTDPVERREFKEAWEAAGVQVSPASSKTPGSKARIRCRSSNACHVLRMWPMRWMSF